jgi:tetratricopeptide (TPR) repeat protein
MKNFISLSAIIIFVLFTAVVPAQKKDNNSPLKTEAQKQMQAGRYGEAIDLLNRYISAFPQRADGYNLRGLCNEKRAQYEQAVYDFRSARKLEPNNKEINKNLSRTTDAWYKLLYNKIEGHKREIAINPNVPRNYLEIGKSYKNLGEWETAEVWYDEYLKREEASADEIIRYTEILAKNGHIKKGEPILKRYTDKYPEDHRLWSRYGYFLLWLGKNKLAIDAFEHALALRPYFREAMDGLDQAKGKGYIYTINDTSARYNYGMPVPQPVHEYAIDKYYRLLKKAPKDNATRYKLIEELVKNQRYQEAFEQIEIISGDTLYADEIAAYRDTVQAIRDSIYQGKIVEYTALLEKNPNDKEAVIQLADYHARLQDYDEALKILENYLASIPEGQGDDVRFKYAQYLTWNYQFEPAIDQLNILMDEDAGNLDYQLLRAQIAVWTAQDLDLAENYLGNVLEKNPDNLLALTSLASMKIRQQKYDEAKTILEKATALDPTSKEVEAIQIYYDASLSNFEGLKIYQILFDGRQMVVDGDCPGALQKYEEYFSKISGPTRMEEIEYANVNVCAGNMDAAFAIYDRLLAEEYDFDLALLRAKAYLVAHDSVRALEEFKKLAAENPDDFDTRLNLAVAYELNHEYGEAEDVYDAILEKTTDSAQVSLVEQRMQWLPQSSFNSMISRFPSHIAFAPQAAYYNDNQDFEFYNMGGRVEFGVTGFLTLGASLIRTHLNTEYFNRYLTAFKGQVFIRPINKLWLTTGFGTLNVEYGDKRNISDASVRYEDPEKLNLSVSYENTDARLILYSPNLINVAYDADLFRFQGSYFHKSGLRLSGYFSYIDIEDGNEGNDLNFRIGKRFQQDLSYGYEYAYSNYKTSSYFYYSPQNFDSHSLWVEWQLAKEKDITFALNGKLGYIPDGDFIVREASADLLYKPFTNLILSARITGGSTYRDESSYNFFSGMVSAYLSFY